MLKRRANGIGINSINYYSPTVFKSIGVQGTSASLLTTGVFGVIKFAVAFIWLLWLVDNVGRKALFIIGSIGGALCMYYLGELVKKQRSGRVVSCELC